MSPTLSQKGGNRTEQAKRKQQNLVDPGQSETSQHCRSTKNLCSLTQSFLLVKVKKKPYYRSSWHQGEAVAVAASERFFLGPNLHIFIMASCISRLG